jgi:hypothetical protein
VEVRYPPLAFYIAKHERADSTRQDMKVDRMVEKT